MSERPDLVGGAAGEETMETPDILQTHFAGANIQLGTFVPALGNTSERRCAQRTVLCFWRVFFPPCNPQSFGAGWKKNGYVTPARI